MIRKLQAMCCVLGCLVLTSAQAQSAADEAHEYANSKPRPGGRPDFKALGISEEQARQVHAIRRAARESGQSPEATRAQLSAVLSEQQLEALHAARPGAQAQAGGPAGAPKNCKRGQGSAPTGQAAARSGS
ncbi:MAG: hypothetical protein RIR70_230 [Pseudomonadota bacterium]